MGFGPPATPFKLKLWAVSKTGRIRRHFWRSGATSAQSSPSRLTAVTVQCYDASDVLLLPQQLDYSAWHSVTIPLYVYSVNNVISHVNCYVQHTVQRVQNTVQHTVQHTVGRYWLKSAKFTYVPVNRKS